MISLNYRDGKPIYEQIKDSLRKMIISGIMPQGEKLPSVRELAAETAINPNTIQKAYRELESEGYIYTVAGLGSFAAEGSEVASKRKQELLKNFHEIAAELVYLGVTEAELRRQIVQGEAAESD